MLYGSLKCQSFLIILPLRLYFQRPSAVSSKEMEILVLTTSQSLKRNREWSLLLLFLGTGWELLTYCLRRIVPYLQLLMIIVTFLQPIPLEQNTKEIFLFVKTMKMLSDF